MKEPQVVSRHQYRWGPKLLSGAIFLGPFVWSLLFFLDEQPLPAVIWLGAGLVIAPFMLPLLLTYTTFVLTVGKDKIEITYLTKTRSILINDIVDVRSRGMNVLESVYVRDRSGNKFSFEKGDVPAAVEFGRVAAAPVNTLRQQTHRCQEISVCF